MNPTQTGIAVALALVVVGVFFIYPGMLPMGGTKSVSTETTDTTLSAQPTTPSAPMPDLPQQITELMVRDEIVGTGVVAAAGDTVTVQYIGTLTDGTVFDASKNHGDQGFSFVLGAGQVIKGWDQGVAGMKEGGKRTLAIPANLAYGDRAVGDVIPANSALLFEVELVKVQKGGK